MQSIQQLNPRHYKILEFCLAGLTNKQIAEQLNMSQQQVSVVLHSPSFQHELSTRRARLSAMTDNEIVTKQSDISETIKAGARSAVERVLGSINSDNERIALAASQDILDRAGFPRVSRTENKSVSISISPDDAKIISESLKLDEQSDVLPEFKK